MTVRQNKGWSDRLALMFTPPNETIPTILEEGMLRVESEARKSVGFAPASSVASLVNVT